VPRQALGDAGLACQWFSQRCTGLSRTRYS
jgi:hypothetical protein